MSLRDQFGRTIIGNDNGDGTITYSTTGLQVTFPATVAVSAIINSFNGMAPSVANLPAQMQITLNNFNNSLQQYVQSYYSIDTQFRLFIIYYLAVQNNLSNRVAYITPLLNWIQNLIDYSTTTISSIETLQDPNAIANYTWDFTQAGPPPNVTLMGAISIND